MVGRCTECGQAAELLHEEGAGECRVINISSILSCSMAAKPPVGADKGEVMCRPMKKHKSVPHIK
jgi:hypothetical protein